MAEKNNIEHRVKSVEEYQVILYEFIDELRAGHAGHERIMQRLAEQQVRLVDIQRDTANILRGMNGYLKDHDTRLSGGGL